MKSIFKSSTFWIAVLMIVVNVLEMVVEYATAFKINTVGVNIIMGIIFILNRLRPKQAMNVYLRKPKDAKGI